LKRQESLAAGKENRDAMEALVKAKRFFKRYPTRQAAPDPSQFKKALLPGVDKSRVEMERADFSGGNLQKANWVKALHKGCNFSQTDLTGGKFFHLARFLPHVADVPKDSQVLAVQQQQAALRGLPVEAVPTTEVSRQKTRFDYANISGLSFAHQRAGFISLKGAMADGTHFSQMRTIRKKGGGFKTLDDLVKEMYSTCSTIRKTRIDSYLKALFHQVKYINIKPSVSNNSEHNKNITLFTKAKGDF
jgi:hypothetical protein